MDYWTNENEHVLVITNTMARFNGSPQEAADSAELINVQMKETLWPFG